MIVAAMFTFVTESNHIEGIHRAPRQEEIAAHLNFVNDRDPPTVNRLESLVSICQPGAVLRSRRGLDVRVGDHIAPPGGPLIVKDLEELLRDVAVMRRQGAYSAHCRYETLHPFTDGNGRSGRALWLWMMMGDAPLGFLHTWYYQSLQAMRLADVE